MPITLLLIYLAVGLGSTYDSSGHDCSIKTGYTTPYVSALRHQMSAHAGCHSNQTTPTTAKEVHIIRYAARHENNRGRRSNRRNSHRSSLYDNTDSKSVSTVTLRLEPRLESGLYDNSVVIFLWSPHPVKWDIEAVRISNSSRFKFVLPKSSRIINSRSLPFHDKVKVKKYDDNFADLAALAQWAQQMEGAVTSISDLPRSSYVVMTLGVDPRAPSICQLEVHSSQSSATLARAVTLVAEGTSACAARWNEGYAAKDVHIIEVHDIPSPPFLGYIEGQISLVIRSKTLPIMAKPLLLVLKAPSNGIWMINVSKFRGDLNIVTNAEVEMMGSPQQDIQTTFDLLEGTGQDLVNWVGDSYGHPVSYTDVEIADKFVLYIDGGESLSYNLDVPSSAGSINRPHNNKHHLLEALQQSRKISCDSYQMVVTLPKQIFKDLGISRNALSFNDPTCRATENSTHFVLTSNYYSCGIIRTVGVHVDRFSNRVIVKLPLSGQENKGRSGNHDNQGGTEEMEGSGSGFGEGVDTTSDTFVDDEDLPTNTEDTISVEVSCNLPQITHRTSVTEMQNAPGREEHVHDVLVQVEYSLELYNDAGYSSPLGGVDQQSINIPVKAGDTIYVQAKTLPQDPRVQVLIKSCNLTSDTYDPRSSYNNIVFFNNGCITMSKNLKLLADGPNKEKRFNFQLQSFTDDSPPFVQCALVLCTNVDIKDYPKCIDQHQFCVKSSIHPATDPLILARPESVRSEDIFIIKNARTGGFIPPSSPPPLPSDGITSPQAVPKNECATTRVVRVEGLDSGTVVGIAFAAFVIGVLLTGALWYIHTHTGPMSRRHNRPRSAETSGESTPSSTAPITIHQIHRFNPPLHHCALLPNPESFRHRCTTAHTTPLHRIILAPIIKKIYEYD